MHKQVSHPTTHDPDSETTVDKDPPPIKHKHPIGIQTPLALTNSDNDIIEERRLIEGSQLIPSKPTRELALDMEDLDIPWGDLVLKERIGSGISPL